MTTPNHLEAKGEFSPKYDPGDGMKAWLTALPKGSVVHVSKEEEGGEERFLPPHQYIKTSDEEWKHLPGGAKKSCDGMARLLLKEYAGQGKIECGNAETVIDDLADRMLQRLIAVISAPARPDKFMLAHFATAGAFLHAFDPGHMPLGLDISFGSQFEPTAKWRAEALWREARQQYSKLGDDPLSTGEPWLRVDVKSNSWEVYKQGVLPLLRLKAFRCDWETCASEAQKALCVFVSALARSDFYRRQGEAYKAARLMALAALVYQTILFVLYDYAPAGWEVQSA